MARVAFLGLGVMGYPMAGHLAAKGHDVTVYNRTEAKAKAWCDQHGGVHGDTPKTAAKGNEMVFACVGNDDDLRSVCLGEYGAFAGMETGTIFVDHTTVSAQVTTELAEAAAERGIAYVDAPVSGGTKGAEAGTLAIMAGGDADAFAAVEGVLRAMGTPVHVGPVGAGQLAKLANQAVVANTIACVAEAMLLLERGGADPAAVRAALKGGFADSTILQQHGRRMTERDFAPGGLTKFQVKDLDNVLEEAAAHGLTLPATEEVNRRFTRLWKEMDGGDLDHSALFLELEARQGGRGAGFPLASGTGPA